MGVQFEASSHSQRMFYVLSPHPHTVESGYVIGIRTKKKLLYIRFYLLTDKV